MRIGDHQLHASEPPARQPPQKGCPEGFGFGGADVHAENLAATVAVDAHGNDRRDRDDPPVPAHFDVSRIDPEVGPVALDRAFEEGIHALINIFTQAAHLALRDAIHAQRLHQIVDRARRDALDIGFLNDGSESLLGHPARLQKAGEVAALAQLRDMQLDLPARVCQSRSR